MPSARSLRCAGDPLRLLLAVSARTVLATAVALVLWAVLPAALGWHVTTVVSGSMAPAIGTGDVVAAVPGTTDDPVVGRVLLVTDPDHDDRLRLHRLARVEADGGLRLRGDANAAEDTSAVAPGDVLGTGVLRVPWVGLPGTWMRSGGWIELAIASAAAVVLVAAARADRSLRAGAPCPGCGAPRWGLRTTLDRHAPDGPAAAAAGGHGPDRPVASAAVRLGPDRPAAAPAGGRRPGRRAVTASPTALGTGLLVALLAATLVALALLAPSGAAFSATTPSSARAGTDAAFPCFAAPTDGAVLAWDFDEKGPSVRDDSGNGHDADPVGPVTPVGGPCGTDPYVSFVGDDGDPRYLSRNQVAAPTTYTIEVWVRTAEARGSIMSFGSERGAASAYKDRRLYVSDTGLAVFGTSSAGWNFTVLSTSRIDDGRWHHLAGSFSGSRMVLYVDGVEQASRTDNSDPLQYDGWWRVGRESVGGWPYQTEPWFSGDIDTARVHDRALRPDEVAEHAARGH